MLASVNVNLNLNNFFIYKILLQTLGIILVFGLSGCNGSENSNQPPSAPKLNYTTNNFGSSGGSSHNPCYPYSPCYPQGHPNYPYDPSSASTINDSVVTLNLKANLSGAIKLAIKKTQPFIQTSETTPLDFQQGHLIELDSSSMFDEVFLELKPKVFSVLSSSSHFIVSGIFNDSEDIAGNIINCHLIAFSKTKINEKAKCLSQVPVGINDLASDTYKIGFSVKDRAVYFANSTEVRKWNGLSDSTEVIFKKDDSTTYLPIHPFVSPVNDHVCVLIRHSDQDSQILCTDPSDPAFEPVNVTADLPAKDWIKKTIQIKDMLITPTNTIRLSTFTVKTRHSEAQDGNDLPAGEFQMVRSEDGNEVIGIAPEYSKRLVHFDDTGRSHFIDSLGNWEKIISNNGHAWVYGNQRLEKINFETCNLEDVNYVKDLGKINKPGSQNEYPHSLTNTTINKFYDLSLTNKDVKTSSDLIRLDVKVKFSYWDWVIHYSVIPIYEKVSIDQNTIFYFDIDTGERVKEPEVTHPANGVSFETYFPRLHSMISLD